MTMKWHSTNFSFSRKVHVLCKMIDNDRVSLKFFFVYVCVRLTSSKLAKRDLLTQQNLHANLYDFRLLLFRMVTNLLTL